MNLLITFLAMVAADRFIPASTWAFSLLSFKTGLGETYKKYGLFSFPRTLLGLSVCIPDFLALFFAIDKNILDVAVLALYFLFGATAVVDAVKAVHSGGYRKATRSKN